ncbi:DNA polymerase III subunit chi [Pseudomonas helleri]|jgi:hypothetical protein|uniref:DNA polymerase III subunit chi n=1 Tax=Pseudomonas helleri TaxID=1608996 RepID=A0A6A7ZA19_9PSED|nr:hypothetical protein [Pseudomonas helleri]KMN21610.1 DNA polymerase III subunit chi [Pseudomonas helleri]MQT36432.1 DNA polymerase III subunit chi [Pseudomonas helleri]MQT74472.1 DNA polymerase III subunit chi [Pseudomonas helleri]MQT95419.1 DNA polymerase III subunit chi [Pseudomonas helleri]MQU21325.1 DNA polymerase III subunit chi [Pseudomonas helleri]
MDTSNSPKKAAHLLDDLESIRQLLGDDGLQPPLLTEMVGHGGEQIPLLSDVIDDTVAPEPNPEPESAQIPLVGIAEAPKAEKAPDALLVHLDKELRTAAQAIMHEVINDFAPHIETEIKRRLDAHMERLLAQHQN